MVNSMARPKTYTDEDLIQAANELISRGKKPSGWRIREYLQRGKSSSIQADLERLIADGRIPEAQNDTPSATTQVRTSYELPAEIQDLLERKEYDISTSLRDIVIAMNDSIHTHFESITYTRIREAEAISQHAIKQKEQSEGEALDIEQTLQRATDANDELEEKIAALQSELVESQNEKSELLKNISQLTSSFNQANDRLENQQDTIYGLQANLSKVEKAHSALTVQREYALNDVERLESQLTELSERYQSTCIKLTESSSKLQSMTEALDNSEHKLSTVQDEYTDLSVNYRILESKLHESQSNISELKRANHELEKQLTYFLEETDSICDAVNDSSSGH
ncbi:hypothetical protein GQ854_23320 [Vibrio parahaemolyticus]|nr:hypothetical protein [Vibrio parahaemolyticus]